MIVAAEEITMKLTQKDLRAFHACARHCDRAMIILKRKGRVQWMTEPARHCVAEFFGDLPAQTNRLPKPMIRWIERHGRERDDKSSALPKSTVIERNGERLVVRLVTDRQEGIHLVRLEKQRQATSAGSLKRLGLSRRETEVLRWLARGMTNAKIGTTLGLSRFTVRTHLEHIYQKLEVQTRTAAAAIAYGESRKPDMRELRST